MKDLGNAKMTVSPLKNRKEKENFVSKLEIRINVKEREKSTKMGVTMTQRGLAENVMLLCKL
jgi:hypothetical protein